MDKAPKHWKSTEELLLGFNNSINALIDTSTPFLWMPNDACDRFAAAFNLTYNETLELYTFQSGQQYEDFLHNSPLSLTFSLSSFDNYDNFAHPLSVNGVVNITVSIAAFAQLVKYPYMNKIGPYESAIPYFPLKRTTHKNRYILGRAFMQEAYMIMRYEEGTFSVHQALMPDNAIYNTDIKSIARPDRSLYDKPPSAPRGRSSLSTAQMAGIASGVCALITAGIATYCCVRRRRRAKNAPPLPEFTLKDAVSSIETVASPLKKPAGRILSIIKWKKSPRENANAAAGTAEHPAEVCGRDNAVYELPVPLEPVELDTHDSSSVNGSTELGSESAQGLSEYEIARRKLERQLQGPVPAYSPPSISQSSSSASKSEQDVSPVAHYRPSDHHPSPPSPLSSPIHGTFANAIPSPITPQVPHSDWGHFPSLMTVAAPATTMPPPPSPEINQGSSIHSSGSAGVCSQTYNPSSVSPSSLTHASATSPVASLAGSVVLPPSPTYQRTPIDPSRVICLGPLPDNIQLPRQPSLPQVAGSSAAASFPRSPVTTRSPHTNILQVQSPPPAQTTTPLGTLNQAARVSVETLGSNFTEEEEERIAEEARQQQSLRLDTTLLQRADYGRSPLTATAGSSAGPLSAVVATPRSAERIEAGVELVHVPQVPEKRYSWEENGTMDDDGPQ